MSEPASQAYVSRGGDKLAAALDHFDVDATERLCADLGSHVGGFVDCLLQRGAARIYSVDTSYGTLAWKLRRHPRVVVLERTNAMHVSLPEPVDLVTIDVGWTPQAKVLPNVARMIRPGADVITLIKPHYEASSAGTARRTKGDASAGGAGDQNRGANSTRHGDAKEVTGGTGDQTRVPSYDSPLVDGVLPEEAVDAVVASVLRQIIELGWAVRATFPSPVPGHGGNREVFALLAHPS